MADELPLYLHQEQYSARLVRRQIADDWDEGVSDLLSFAVVQRGAGANMSVDVSAGSAIVAGDDQSEQGSYSCRRTSTVNVVVGAAPGSNSRYDLIVLRINDPDATGPAGNTFTTVVVPGTAAASPVDPAVPNSAIVLARIGPITTSTTAITTGMILDRRPLAGRKCTPGIVEWQATAVAPNGWLLCTGQAVSRTTYARLFAHIATTFGVGDGSTTFNLPNLTDRVPVGVGTLGALGATGGATTHTLTQAQLPNVTLTIDPPSNLDALRARNGSGVDIGNYGLLDTGGTDTVVNSAVGYGSGAGTRMAVDIAPFQSGNLGSGTAHNIVQPYLALNAIIRT